jgi:Putative zinc-finger
MCEFSGRLIAWFDRELPAGEAADVERHVRVCAECRSQLGAYERVSAALEAYCDAAMASKLRRRPPRWRLEVSGAAAVAGVLLLALLHARLQSPRIPPPAAPASQLLFLETERPPAVPAKSALRIEKVPRQQLVSAAPREDAMRQKVTWLSAEPAIQIAIPAEAMFPPGAVPEGVSFTADLTIAADGSAQRLRLGP